jgi:sugar phosphate permease
LGSVLAASPLAWALGFVSWREVFVAVGVLSLGLAWLAGWLVRDNPVQAGLPSMRALEGRADHAPHQGHWYDGIREVAGNRLTWPGFFLNLGMTGSLFAFAGLWAIPFLTQGHGWTRPEAAAHTTLLLAAFAVGAFGIGLISDHLGRRKPVVLAACLVYVLCWLPLALGWKPQPGWSHALFIVMGLGGSGFTLSWACAKEVNRHALSGTATALVNTGGFLGAAILQPLTGWVMDRAAGGGPLQLAHYQTGLWLLAACAAGGALAGLWLKETRCRYLQDQT